MQMLEKTQVELPFWMTGVLVQRNMISVDVPKVVFELKLDGCLHHCAHVLLLTDLAQCFGPRFKMNLLADPTVVNLRVGTTTAENTC